MLRTRVYTENKNHSDILETLKTIFPDGFTVFNAVGFWQGTSEKSLVIEVLTECSEEEKLAENIEHLIYWLKKHNGQNSVLVTSEQVFSHENNTPYKQ